MRGQHLFGVRVGSVVAAVAGLSIAETGWATQATYRINATGAQEVPGGSGDPDGIANGFITLNDVSGLISWNLQYSNIVTPTDMHIHTGAFGVSGGVLIPLGVGGTGGAGQLINTITYGTLGNITSVLANPAGFYLNIHNGTFPAGAVRGQFGTVPAPGTLALLALGGLAQRRRRR